MILARFPMAVRGSLPTALATGLALAMPVPAAAEPDFYSGKSIQVLIGFSAGGGYDIYARTLARHMGRHIPGNPRHIPGNPQSTSTSSPWALPRSRLCLRRSIPRPPRW